MFGPQELLFLWAIFLAMHNGAMSHAITLSGAGLRCEIKPEPGGCIAGLWLDGVPVLRSTPAAELATVRRAGSYPLVPFSNRVGHATLNWQGTSHPLVQNNAPEPHAIHGVSWQASACWRRASP